MILFSPRILAIELLLLSILFLRSHLVLDLLFSLKSFNFLILHIFLLAKKKATHTKRYFSWLEVNSTAKKEYDDGKKKKLRCGCLFKGWTMTIFLLRILYEERENRQNGKHLTKLKIKKRDKKLLPSPSYCELTRSCNHYNHTRRNSSARETFLIKGRLVSQRRGSRKVLVFQEKWKIQQEKEELRLMRCRWATLTE